MHVESVKNTRDRASSSLHILEHSCKDSLVGTLDGNDTRQSVRHESNFPGEKKTGARTAKAESHKLTPGRQ